MSDANGSKKTYYVLDMTDPRSLVLDVTARVTSMAHVGDSLGFVDAINETASLMTDREAIRACGVDDESLRNGGSVRAELISRLSDAVADRLRSKGMLSAF